MRSKEEIAADVAANEMARAEMLRRDGQRPLGENIERGAQLIKDAQELARAFAMSRGRSA